MLVIATIIVIKVEINGCDNNKQIIKIIFLWGQKIIFFPVSKLSRKNMKKRLQQKNVYGGKWKNGNPL